MPVLEWPLLGRHPEETTSLNTVAPDLLCSASILTWSVCRYPGAVASPSGFFDKLCDSATLQSTVPLDRWDSDALLSVGQEANKIYARVSATLASPIADFDTGMFGMNKAEASATDPQVCHSCGYLLVCPFY